MIEAIAALSVATGIAPNDLMDTDFQMLEAMVEAVRKRGAQP
jgi:hypothetical protein